MLPLFGIKRLLDLLNHLGRQIRRQFRQLIGVQRGGSGHQLRRIHAGDEALAHGVRRLDQNVTVAVRLDQIPDEDALVERQRFENVRDVGRMQLVELRAQSREHTLNHRALRRIVERIGQAFRETRQQPVLSYQRNDVA